MVNKFENVEYCVKQAAFYFDEMAKEKEDYDRVSYMFSAFAYGGRCIYFAVKHAGKAIPSFDTWFGALDAKLNSSGLDKFFVDARNTVTHEGHSPVLYGSTAGDIDGFVEHFFQVGHPNLPNPPEDGVLASSKDWLVELLSMVWECYTLAGPEIDPLQYATYADFCKLGYSLDKYCEEAGWPNLCDREAEVSNENRFDCVRDFLRGLDSERMVDAVFQRFLNKPRPYLT
ncbi:hypothetical protein KOR34_44810 [Posidoniimonas corsicana]|uniref:Uncharacterized protein n=1 Tax=Posidoniimonas corsicana TaxID=1938618 RepID=A0A5C5V039_9BACT|nr:hypothetical protein [Posidoniimonas corsicana]TWT31107.1 hypothetical protein KOR34_44810 [Posidoniimonas corsicana]